MGYGGISRCRMIVLPGSDPREEREDKAEQNRSGNEGITQLETQEALTVGSSAVFGLTVGSAISRAPDQSRRSSWRTV
jgi:hypothetical protein